MALQEMQEQVGEEILATVVTPIAERMSLVTSSIFRWSWRDKCELAMHSVYEVAIQTRDHEKLVAGITEAIDEHVWKPVTREFYQIALEYGMRGQVIIDPPQEREDYVWPSIGEEERRLYDQLFYNLRKWIITSVPVTAYMIALEGAARKVEQDPEWEPATAEIVTDVYNGLVELDGDVVVISRTIDLFLASR